MKRDDGVRKRRMRQRMSEERSIGVWCEEKVERREGKEGSRG